MPLMFGSDKIQPNYKVNLKKYGQIFVCAFSPYELSQDLLLIAFENRILITNVVFQDEIIFKILAEMEHDVQCTALSISPDTNISCLPSNIVFCTAGHDYKLRLHTTDLKENNSCQVLVGHTNFINEIAYDPENNYIASVSDDNTAKVWSISEQNCVSTFYLSSPGMSVNWHKEDNSKLLVAEKLGIIRFYNVNTQKPILSFDYSKPLSGAHWAPNNPQLVASLHLGELLLWDITKPSRPLNSKLIHAAPSGCVKFNSSGELVATVNQLEGVLKVMLVSTQQQRLHANLMLPTSPAWHYNQSIVCVAQDNLLCFWRISNQ